MPTYNYVCSNTECNKTYLEHRDVDDPQFVTNCDICGAVYNAVN
jgi:predicted nucleic acid-binding Zn ribbon protein